MRKVVVTIRTRLFQEIKVFLENVIAMGIFACMNGQKYGGNPSILQFFHGVRYNNS